MADQNQLYEDYSKVLEQVAASPYDRALHLRHIELLTQLRLDDEVSSAIDLYATHLSIQPGEFLPFGTSYQTGSRADGVPPSPQRAG